MDTLVDASFLNQMEMKWSDVKFTRVDSDITDNLIDKIENDESVLTNEEKEKLKTVFELKRSDLNVTVEIKGLSQEMPPVLATRPEFMRRMKDMSAMSGPMGSFYASMPDEVTLTVNGNHPIFQRILAMEPTLFEKHSRNLADLALLSQGLLKGGSLTEFISRSVELM